MPCYDREAQDSKAAATENLVIKLWLKIKSKAKKKSNWCKLSPEKGMWD